MRSRGGKKPKEPTRLYCVRRPISLVILHSRVLSPLIGVFCHEDPDSLTNGLIATEADSDRIDGRALIAKCGGGMLP